MTAPSFPVGRPLADLAATNTSAVTGHRLAVSILVINGARARRQSKPAVRVILSGKVLGAERPDG